MTLSSDLLLLMPVRSAHDASLKGFELRVRDVESAVRARVSWPDTAVPAVEQVQELLSSGLALLLSSAGLRLWLPLAASRLLDGGIERLQRVLVASPVAMADIVLVLDARDRPEGPWQPASVRLASEIGCPVAVGVPPPGSDALMTLLALPAVREVRYAMHAWPDAQAQAQGTEVAAPPRWHRLVRTALDVSTADECERAIAGGCELLQGGFVGRARSMGEVQARVESGYSSIESVL